MKRARRLRARTLVGALVVLGLAWLAASHAAPNAKARPRNRHPRAEPQHAGRHLPADSPWASPAACANALAKGGAARAAGVARVGAWNLHWFPDGRPGEGRPGSATDLDWLACSIAWMRLDVLALEEIKRPPRGEAALGELRSLLDRLTGGNWQSLLDDCPRASSQHVGLLYDAKRVTLRGHAVVAALNPLGEPCKSQLRPGLAGYFAFPGGLDLTLVAAHLKSGVDARGIDDRSRSFAAFAGAAAGESERTRDRDVLFLGDMNTMGCESCTPVITSAAELARVDALFATSAAKITRVGAEPMCSHHYGSHNLLLDWAATSDLDELPRGRQLHVSGPCGELGCEGLHGELAAQRTLSDHCPIWLDLDDVDRD